MKQPIGARSKAETGKDHCIVLRYCSRQVKFAAMTANVLSTMQQLQEGVLRLIEREPRFESIVAAYGLPSLRRTENSLPALLRIVTDQLISLSAGAAIWRRLEDSLQPFDPGHIAGIPENRLLALGLSGAKAKTFKAAAAAVCDGQLDFAQLEVATDHQVAVTLQRVKGVGPWTADIYLLSALGRADSWPAGDLALQRAAQDLFDLPTRPAPPAMITLAMPWMPWRAVAARLLWSHYRGLRGLPQADP